uniref:Complement component 1 Q subcomponent-binding protein, mitochondrial n=1 Tax=Pelusios castaneus TaxID=367368 RepID=A0A8C8SE83_9SAUR
MLLIRALRAAASTLRPLPPSFLPFPLLRPAALLCAPRPPAAARAFTRNIWLLSGDAAGTHRPGILRPQRVSPAGLSCGCGGLHTEGDKAFVNFLSDEINVEKKIQNNKSLPKMSGGWAIEVHGAQAKLLRKIAGETITVTFNVNNSIPPTYDEPQEQQKDHEQEAELTSTPNFVVEVTKANPQQTLVFDCHYPEDELARGGEDEESDIFLIEEVSFQPSEESDWKDTNFTLNTQTLDCALYDHFMDFLADRGVDNTFAHELIELSTALEHEEYIKFLENLQGFMKCQ